MNYSRIAAILGFSYFVSHSNFANDSVLCGIAAGVLVSVIIWSKD